MVKDSLYTAFFNAKVGSEEYNECLKKIRLSETGGHTFGLDLTLKKAQVPKGAVSYNFSKVI